MRYIFYILIFLPTHLFSQIDYGDFKDEKKISCSVFDSVSVVKTQQVLDSLSQFEINNKKDVFLIDISMTYYVRYGKWKQIEDLNRSIYYAEQGFEQFELSNFAWNLAFNYRIKGQCKASQSYLQEYLSLAKKEELPIDYEQVYRISNACFNIQELRLNLSSIETGMNKKEVQAIAGQPDNTYELGSGPNGAVEMWHYENGGIAMSEVQFEGDIVSKVILDYQTEQDRLKKLMKN